MKQSEMPEIVDKSQCEIDAIICKIQDSALSDEIKSFIIKCINLAIWLPLKLQDKHISLSRFREMVFGKGYKHKHIKHNDSEQSILTSSTENNVPHQSDEVAVDVESSERQVIMAENNTNEASSKPPQANKAPKPGHGRMAHTAYDIFTEIRLALAYQLGDPCPELCGGKLYYYEPGVIVRIKGQASACVYHYTVEKLRCALCGLIVSAMIPPEVGHEKYDVAFKAWLAIQKYFMAVPLYRQEACQRMLGFPLPDATQWDLIEQLAGCCYAVFNVFKQLAANGTLLHNDDTRLRILDVIKRLKQTASDERRGMYTTGIIAIHEDKQIALFLNGTKHSGENVRDVLSLRDTDKAPMIQMFDALSANVPSDVLTILCNCLSHGFRKFVELVDFYEKPCATIMTLLSQVFAIDAATRNMTAQVRLAHHQAHSEPIMNELAQYMAGLIDTRQVEPNSQLGKAIKYMQNHWLKLTRFLKVAFAPIDNNIVERSLKIAIRTRKAAMFYRSTYSANIAGMITSLIYTCHLAKQNPKDYLIALQTYKASVTVNPKAWPPWNYQQTRKLIQDAKQEVHSPPAGHLVVT